jgi:recombination protein RecR
MKFPQTIQSPLASLTKLSGVGERSALRMVMAMTRWSAREREEFINGLQELNHLKECQDCGMWCDDALCEVCLNPERKNSNLLCLVENASDVIAIERSGHYRGLFLVLGGVLNPLLGIGPEHLRFELLLEQVREQKIENLILALNPSVEGDATCSYIKRLLPENVHVERIGFGMPIGGSLEYVDPMTIAKALDNRKTF